ncbi:MAG: hypothetical protein ACX930_01740 [Erythrobacter sp.]
MTIRLAFLLSPLVLMACGSEIEGEGVADGPAVARDAAEQPAGNGVALEKVTEPSFAAEPRPVRIGLDGPDFDACGSFGVITGLNPDGDNFLSVRSAPSTDGEELDRITSDTGVSLCDSAPGWIGIVYEGAGKEGFGCGVGSPVSSVRTYGGSCRSGWVSERFVEVIAG